MNDRTVTLLGTEAVTNAASKISASAAAMERAASSINESLERHQRFMEDWLQRFEQALKENIP